MVWSAYPQFRSFIFCSIEITNFSTLRLTLLVVILEDQQPTSARK